jgi:hypothetical protein
MSLRLFVLLAGLAASLADGTFAARVGSLVRVEAERDGKSRTFLRTFTVRKQ